MKAITVAEPFIIKPIGILPYIEALHHVCYYLKLTAKPMDSLSYGLKLEKAYEEYRNATNEPSIDGKQLFFINRAIDLPRNFDLPEAKIDTIYRSQLGAIYLIYDELGNTDKCIKYTAGAIKSDIDASRTEGGMFYLLEQILLKLDPILTEFHFKHLDYLLSIAMHHAVKLRRSWPQEKRAELNNLQGRLSLLFGQWGEAIYLGSCCLLNNQTPTFVCSKPEFDRIPELEETGIDEYANQFPHDYITSLSQLKSIQKRAFQWAKRAVDLLDEGEDKRIAKGLRQTLKRDEMKMKEFEESIESPSP